MIKSKYGNTENIASSGNNLITMVRLFYLFCSSVSKVPLEIRIGT